MKKGFTLIELLVVVSIIGVLATIILSSLNETRQRAQEAVVFSEVRSLRQALELYYLDNNQYPIFDSNATWSYMTGLCADDGSGTVPPGYDEFLAEMENYISAENIDSNICVYYSSNTNTGYSGSSNWLCDNVVFTRGQGYIMTWYTINKISEPWFSGRNFGPPWGAEHCATHIR